MSPAPNHPLSRRAFLRRSAAIGGGVAATGVLAACGGAATPPAPTAPPVAPTTASALAPTAAPAPATTAKAGVATVRVLTADFFYDAMVLPATAIFNDEHQDTTFVKVEKAPDGWVTKALAMVRDKNVLWSSYAVDSFFELYQRIQTGLCQPLDAYINSSNISFAKNFKDQYISPVVYNSGVFKGKFYIMPTKLNMTITPYNITFVQGAGYDKPPETWDETRVMLHKIKDKYAKDDVWPTHVDMDLWRSIGGIYCSMADKPYDDEGMVKLDSPEWFATLDLIKGLYTDKLANPALIGTPEGQATWQKGKIALIWNYPSWLNLAKAAWGNQVYTATNMMRKEKGSPNRTWLHVDGTYLISNAPNPQETVNWMLSMLGPEGKSADAFAAGTVSRSGSPMYKTHIESKIVKGNADYPWLYDTYKMMDVSTAAPLSPLHFLVDAAGKKYLPPVFKGEADAKEAVAKMKDEVQKNKDKMLSGQG